MTLTALNRPKDAFWITIIASVANILLNFAFIPIMGITGAAVATLISMTFNALGVIIFLSRIIPVRIEFGPIKNITCAAILMGVFLLFIHFFLPFNHVLTVFAAVIAGAIIYIFVLFRLDQQIYHDIRELSVNLGIPWPGWL
jgi:O-antigen/teichoic acid export membrane protein